ncbi:transposase [Actinomadura sp. 6N118]|uniref:transposase n=1 Tax=Actinomadura sp. 6N118 TaxID=3375151 RepID=UPI0037BB09D7
MLIALASSDPPGRPVREETSGELAALIERWPDEWTLDSLTQAARELGIDIGRSQVRRILLDGGCGGGGPGPGPPAPTPTSPKRTRIVELCTAQPEGSTVICADELGPVTPRVRRAARTRRAGDHHDRPVPQQRLLPGVLQQVEDANPDGQIIIVTDNLSSHNSKSTRTWLEDHPRIRHAFIPIGACWLNLQEGWWRIFRKKALAGQTFADPDEIAYATRLATAHLNTRARPWIWGRPPAQAAHAPTSLCVRP